MYVYVHGYIYIYTHTNIYRERERERERETKPKKEPASGEGGMESFVSIQLQVHAWFHTWVGQRAAKALQLQEPSSLTLPAVGNAVCWTLSAFLVSEARMGGGERKVHAFEPLSDLRSSGSGRKAAETQLVRLSEHRHGGLLGNHDLTDTSPLNISANSWIIGPGCCRHLKAAREATPLRRLTTPFRAPLGPLRACCPK